MHTLALPVYTRWSDQFRELFGVPADAVLARMDAAGDDVPNMAPAVPLDIDAVGMRRAGLVVQMRNPFGGGGEVQAVCSLDLSARVPKSHRGAHVSRLGTAVADGAAEIYADPIDYAQRLARVVAELEYGAADVRVHARVPYLEEVSAHRGRRAKRSLEHLHLLARCRMADGRTTIDAGLRVSHIVACPCVQMTYRHALASAAAAGVDALAGAAAGPPLMTHSQRCRTTVMVRDLTAPFVMREALAAIDRVLVRTCNTLSRDAELACVYRAHRAAQFIEDAVRASVTAVSGLWAPRIPFRAIDAHARSAESIHEFDLRASLVMTAEDARRLTLPASL